jgi:hypothetical protein
MKYETPELAELTAAIPATQGLGFKNLILRATDGITPQMPIPFNEHWGAYEDWE